LWIPKCSQICPNFPKQTPHLHPQISFKTCFLKKCSQSLRIEKENFFFFLFFFPPRPAPLQSRNVRLKFTYFLPIAHFWAPNLPQIFISNKTPNSALFHSPMQTSNSPKSDPKKPHPHMLELDPRSNSSYRKCENRGPVLTTGTFSSGSGSSASRFRDCSGYLNLEPLVPT
jgi:hypothetical protein